MTTGQPSTAFGSIPDRTSPQWRLLDRQCVWHPFTQHQLWNALPANRLPLVITHGEREFVFDSAGRRYIDGHASLWCNVHGHQHPHINAAIVDQLGKIAHSTMLGLTHPPGVELARRLIALAHDEGLTQLTKVFYSDDGSTAVEAACKMAFAYWQHTRPVDAEPRDVFVALGEAYHGDTLGAVSVGGIARFREVFRPLLFRVAFAPPPHSYRCQHCASRPASSDCQPHQPAGCVADVARLLEQHRGRVAGVIIEPLVQCAAGIYVHPPGYLAEVARLCREHDVLLIADEVATGFGRTGRMFACSHERVCPDLLCLSKSLTGGYLPLAATLASARVYDAFLGPVDSGRTLYHGHTFTGNPLGCRAALASLELFAMEDTLGNVVARAEQLQAGLKQLRGMPNVGDIRQRGLIAGVELVRNPTTGEPFAYAEQVGARVCHEMLNDGVIARPLADTVVIFPPLCISASSLEQILLSLRRSMGVVLGTGCQTSPVEAVDGLE